MKRLVGRGHREAIDAAFQLIPPAIGERLRHTHFFCGTDPLYAGLHATEDTVDGRSYRETAHVCFGRYHLDHRPLAERITTVVLPVAEEPWVVVHELGHVLDDLLDFEHQAQPVTAYARRNRYEAFAEAFTAHCVPNYAGPVDEATASLFAALEESWV